MDIKPKISIIIPVYNVERYIDKCINSIKNQTFKDFEAIIVDDGSKDSSIAICKNLINSDSRFKILHKTNGGLMSAWKFGVRHANSDYIGFVDSDDWIDTDMYEKLYAAIQQYDADIVVSGYVTEGKFSQSRWTREKLFIFEGKAIRDSFIKEYCCSYFYSESHPSINRWDKLYKRTLILDNLELFNEKVSLAEDFNMNIPVILDANRIVLLPGFTPYHYRFNPKSIVNTINPKAFVNVKELGDAIHRALLVKEFDSVYIHSFVGNIIFEEINKICRATPLSDFKPEILSANLGLCSALYYLNSYKTVRATKRICIYIWFIKHRHFYAIWLLNAMYNRKIKLKTH